MQAYRFKACEVYPSSKNITDGRTNGKGTSLPWKPPGLATGDALGTTLEFKPPGSFKPIRDIVN